jgi:hypothetical protein
MFTRFDRVSGQGRTVLCPPGAISVLTYPGHKEAQKIEGSSRASTWKEGEEKGEKGRMSSADRSGDADDERSGQEGMLTLV